MRESPQAIEAYGIYRDMGTTRSLERVAQECTKSRSLIARWSVTHDWRGRIADHERDVARRRDEEAQRADAAERERLRKLRLTIAATEQTIALRRLNGIIKDEAAVAGLEVRDVVALLKSAHDTQRLEYGDATERTEANGSWVVEIVEVPRGTRG